jgi:hypothetical protein
MDQEPFGLSPEHHRKIGGVPTPKGVGFMRFMLPPLLASYASDD